MTRLGLRVAVGLLLFALGCAYLIFVGEPQKRARQSEDAAATHEGPALEDAVTDSLEVPQRPPVDEAHIFDGEINRRGRPTGFHSRPGGQDPTGARVLRIERGPNANGVYEARVEIRDPATGRWLDKRSSFFPDRLSRGEVLGAIRNAWRRRTSESTEPWRGPSGLGFEIQGYLHRDGTVATAYPLYR